MPAGALCCTTSRRVNRRKRMDRIWFGPPSASCHSAPSRSSPSWRADFRSLPFPKPVFPLVPTSPHPRTSGAHGAQRHYPALSLAIVEGHSRAAASGVGQACTGHSVTLLQYRDNLGLDEYCASTRDQPSAACRDLTFLCPVKAGIGATMTCEGIVLAYFSTQLPARYYVRAGRPAGQGHLQRRHPTESPGGEARAALQDSGYRIGVPRPPGSSRRAGGHSPVFRLGYLGAASGEKP